MQSPRLVVALLFCAVASADKKWGIYAEKKPSPVTGARWISVSKLADKGQQARFLIACQGEKKLVQIRQDFGLQNGISDALTKSQVERQINKGYQFEKYGFLMSTENGKSTVNVKMRFAAEEKYLDLTVDAYIDSARPSQQHIVLDGQLQWLLERIQENAVLLVELPYKTGGQAVTFRFAGFDAVLAKAKQAGCVLR